MQKYLKNLFLTIFLCLFISSKGIATRPFVANRMATIGSANAKPVLARPQQSFPKSFGSVRQQHPLPVRQQRSLQVRQEPRVVVPSARNSALSFSPRFTGVPLMTAISRNPSIPGIKNNRINRVNNSPTQAPGQNNNFRRRRESGLNWKSAISSSSGFATSYAVYSGLNKFDFFKNTTIGQVLKFGISSVPAVVGVCQAAKSYVQKNKKERTKSSTGKKILQGCGIALAGAVGLGLAYVAKNGVSKTKALLFETLALNKIIESLSLRYPQMTHFFEDRKFKKYLSSVVANQDEASLLKLLEYILEVNPSCADKLIDNLADVFADLAKEDDSEFSGSRERFKELGTNLLEKVLSSSKIQKSVGLIINKTASKIKNDPKKVVDFLMEQAEIKAQPEAKDEALDKTEGQVVPVDNSLCIDALTGILKELNKKNVSELKSIDSLLKTEGNCKSVSDLMYEVRQLGEKVGPYQTRMKCLNLPGKLAVKLNPFGK